MKSKKLRTIVIVIVVLIVAGVLGYVLTENLRLYNKARQAEQDKKYQEALIIYQNIPEYKDVINRTLECKYNIGMNLENDGKYAEAEKAFVDLNGYSDSKEHILNCKYQQAIMLENDGKYAEAEKAFEDLNGYSDSEKHILNCKYQQAIILENDGKYSEAEKAFEDLNGYSNSEKHIMNCKYQRAMALEESGSAAESLKIFEKLGKYKDSSEHANSIKNIISKFEKEKARVTESDSKIKNSIASANELIDDTYPLLDESLLSALKTETNNASSKIVEISDLPLSTLEEIISATDIFKKIDYTLDIESLDKSMTAVKNSRAQYALVDTPTEEFIIDRLKTVSNVAYVKAATEENDPNGQLGKQGGYIAQVFFSSPLVNPRYMDMPNLDIVEKGTDCGGSIEVYNTPYEAELRNAYLGGFDGTPFSSGSHKVIGTIIIRTSYQLKASDQKKLESEIVSALTSLSPNPINKGETDETKNIDKQEELSQNIKSIALNTGHFTVLVPSDWIHVSTESGWNYYYAEKLRENTGGYLGIKQDDSTIEYFDSNMKNSDIEELLESYAGGILGEKKGSIEHTKINDLHAVTVRYAESDTKFFNMLVVFHEGYTLGIGYSDENYDSNESWEKAQKFFSTVSLSEK